MLNRKIDEALIATYRNKRLQINLENSKNSDFEWFLQFHQDQDQRFFR